MPFAIAPWEYELELDENGWVDLDQLLNALRGKDEWKQVEEKDLQELIAQSDKVRHDVTNGKIRALYGHTDLNKIKKDLEVPPNILYHGTARGSVHSIKENGLLASGRQYVHLSVDIDTALQVGKRKDDIPVILIVDAKTAWADGIKFYIGNDKVWLADFVPGRYISIVD